MDAQSLINVLFTLAGALGGWILNSLRSEMKVLQEADSMLMDKVHTIDLLVVGQYVKRDQLERMEEALFSKLDRIEAKLDGKADK